VLLFKIFLAPALIGLVSLAGRKWGHGVAGWLLGFPLTSAPVLLILALDHGRAFASSAAQGCLLGILAWVTFNLVYAYCSLRLSWWYCAAIGWTAYLVVAALVLPVRIAALWSFLLVSAFVLVALMLFPRVPSSSSSGQHWKYELLLRMATATAIVLTITGIAELLGPAASGVLTTFPVYTTILAVFSHRHEASAAVNTLRGVTAGLYTAVTFFIILSLTLLHLGIATAFAAAMAGSLLVQGASLMYVQRSS
jgi:hypothetical protein